MVPFEAVIIRLETSSSSFSASSSSSSCLLVTRSRSVVHIVSWFLVVSKEKLKKQTLYLWVTRWFARRNSLHQQSFRYFHLGAFPCLVHAIFHYATHQHTTHHHSLSFSIVVKASISSEPSFMSMLDLSSCSKQWPPRRPSCGMPSRLTSLTTHPPLFVVFPCVLCPCLYPSKMGPSKIALLQFHVCDYV